jgi:hypothetical protein
MTFASVAIGGGALIGGGMATQAYFGNKSSQKAARAANDAYGQMMRAKQAALGYQRPYEAGGRGGFNALTGLLTGQQYDQNGNVSATLNPEEQSALFKKSPGYQFRLEQAQNALTASQAARGGLLSGGAMKEMNAYTQGIASDEYGNYINQLSGLAGMGQQAANNMSNIETGAGAIGAGYAQQAGMSLANGDAQIGNIVGGGLGQVGGSLLGGAISGLSGGGFKGGGTSGGSTNFFSAGGGQFNNSVFSGSNMPNTNLSRY